MKKTTDFSILSLATLTFLLAQGLPELALAESTALSADTNRELAQVKRATAKYHNIDSAYADGYIDANFYLAGVGCHLINPGYLDGSFELTKPELLIYKDCTPGQGGKAEFRAIEYATFCGGPPTCTLPVPEGLSGDADIWTPGPNSALWTLHVWTWRHNPDGIFVKVNPRITD